LPRGSLPSSSAGPRRFSASIASHTCARACLRSGNSAAPPRSLRCGDSPDAHWGVAHHEWPQWLPSDWPTTGSARRWPLPAQVDDMEDMMRGVVHVLDDDGVFVCQAYIRRSPQRHGTQSPILGHAVPRLAAARPNGPNGARSVLRRVARSGFAVGRATTLRFCRCIAGRAHDCCGKCS
jgi:hypothetical protein